MSDEVWTARVKVRAFMKEDMPQYKQVQAGTNSFPSRQFMRGRKLHVLSFIAVGASRGSRFAWPPSPISRTECETVQIQIILYLSGLIVHERGKKYMDGIFKLHRFTREML